MKQTMVWPIRVFFIFDFLIKPSAHNLINKRMSHELGSSLQFVRSSSTSTYALLSFSSTSTTANNA